MIAVHVLARGLSIVNRVRSIIRPQSVNEVVLILQLSAACSFTESVQGSTVALIRYEIARVNDELRFNKKSERI
jgi:hypothetical protein